jgi:hypothetical protein
VPDAVKHPIDTMTEAGKSLYGALPEGLRNPREGLRGAIADAKERIVGSGEVTTEMKRLGKAYVNAPVSALMTPPKALWQLCKLNGSGALGAISDGIKNTLSATADILTSPTRLAHAGVDAASSAVGYVAKAPLRVAAGVVNSPFYVYDKIDRGADYILKSTTGKLIEWEKSGWHIKH